MNIYEALTLQYLSVRKHNDLGNSLGAYIKAAETR